MWPGAAVCGWYFSHPQSQYFVVGRLGRDQVEEYAERKGWTLAEAERWLAPNLGYQARGLTGIAAGAALSVPRHTVCSWFPPCRRAARRTSSSARCSTGSASIDKLAAPPSPAAARGTLVHAVLERLFDLPADERTPERRPRPARAAVGARSSRRSPSSPTLISDDEQLTDGVLVRRRARP